MPTSSVPPARAEQPAWMRDDPSVRTLVELAVADAEERAHLAAQMAAGEDAEADGGAPTVKRALARDPDVMRRRKAGELCVMRGHEGTVVCLAVNHRVVVSGGADKMVIVWHPSEGRMLRRLRGHELSVTAIAIDDAVQDGNSILRMLHYPPQTEPPPEGSVRAGAHEDINVITLLLGAEEGGLEVLHRNGQWLGVNPPAGSLVVNVGDMLQRLTNHVLPSTTHRVVNPKPERSRFPRYSTPFFLHFNPDYEIKTLPSCISADRPNRYPEPLKAQDFLEIRLKEIGLRM